jgi:hypothetical protein
LPGGINVDETKSGSDEQRFPADDHELTPPHGDELRSSETFGRTDRYANVDDATADKTENVTEQGGAVGSFSGETLGGPKANVIGRGGDAIVQDRITSGRPLEGEEPDDVHRRAP